MGELPPRPPLLGQLGSSPAIATDVAGPLALETNTATIREFSTSNSFSPVPEMSTARLTKSITAISRGLSSAPLRPIGCHSIKGTSETHGKGVPPNQNSFGETSNLARPTKATFPSMTCRFGGPSYSGYSYFSLHRANIIARQPTHIPP